MVPPSNYPTKRFVTPDDVSSSLKADSTSPKVLDAKVIWLHRWNDHLLSLRIERDPGYQFVPGQFARIGLAQQNGAIIWRAYSIVSAPEEPFLEFFMVVVPSGEFSSRVAVLERGHAMRLEPPAQGFLTLDRFRDGQDLWLIATGTGLAPYISMLRDPDTWRRFERVVVVYSAREHRDFGYLDELLALVQKWGQERLKVVKTLTRDPAVASVLHGRVTTLTESGELERAAGCNFDHSRSRFLLCGNPEMVDAMRAILKARGFAMNRKLTPGHIIVENYW